MDPHWLSSLEPDPDPHLDKKLDPDQHFETSVDPRADPQHRF
jgi:hypothetical protein